RTRSSSRSSAGSSAPSSASCGRTSSSCAARRTRSSGSSTGSSRCSTATCSTSARIRSGPSTGESRSRSASCSTRGSGDDGDVRAAAPNHAGHAALASPRLRAAHAPIPARHRRNHRRAGPGLRAGAPARRARVSRGDHRHGRARARARRRRRGLAARDRLLLRDRRVGLVLLLWALFTIAGGLMEPYIDNGAHIGGALGGALVARALHPVVLSPLGGEQARSLRRRLWLVAVLYAYTVLTWVRG